LTDPLTDIDDANIVLPETEKLPLRIVCPKIDKPLPILTILRNEKELPSEAQLSKLKLDPNLQ
jgi:hypothetical protein